MHAIHHVIGAGVRSGAQHCFFIYRFGIEAPQSRQINLRRQRFEKRHTQTIQGSPGASCCPTGRFRSADWLFMDVARPPLADAPCSNRGSPPVCRNKSTLPSGSAEHYTQEIGRKGQGHEAPYAYRYSRRCWQEQRTRPSDGIASVRIPPLSMTACPYTIPKAAPCPPNI